MDGIRTEPQCMEEGGAALPPPVVVAGLRKTYPGAPRPVLGGLDLVCPAGGITVLVGPSGCGKTTLLRCLSGLETAEAGAIRFGNRDVTMVPAERRGIAMVFQNYALYPAKTVAENIAFPLRMAGVGRAEREARVRAAARLVRIEPLLDRLPAQLSGGQRQRVGIARAIVRGPQVLLMDEPLSNLDTKLRMEMRTELGALQRQIRATTVYVTHDQGEALALADHLVIMQGGAIEQQGAAGDVFARPATIFVAEFLGAMNLVHGRAEGKVFLAETGGAINLPGPAPIEGPAILGFRAEELAIGGDGPADSDALRLQAVVRRTELLGTESLVHLAFGGCALRARLVRRLERGATVTLYVARPNAHWFTREGRRVAGDP